MPFLYYYYLLIIIIISICMYSNNFNKVLIVLFILIMFNPSVNIKKSWNIPFITDYSNRSEIFQVVTDNCDPVFEETFEYLLSKSELTHTKLILTVKTKKLFFNSNVIGQVKTICVIHFFVNVSVTKFIYKSSTFSNNLLTTLQLMQLSNYLFYGLWNTIWF